MSLMKILMVDDSPILLKIQTSIVAKLGHEVVGVASGADAIEALKKQPFHLVLMDMQMPCMDGLQTTQAIRSLGIKTPIIALTGNEAPEDKQRCQQQGMNGFLSKPLRTEALDHLITRLVF